VGLILAAACNKVNTTHTHFIHFLTLLKDLKKLMKNIFMQIKPRKSAWICISMSLKKMSNYSYLTAAKAASRISLKRHRRSRDRK